MKHESGIDRIFREGVGQPDFPGTDAAWAKMEQLLDADKRRRRPLAWWLVAAMLLLVSGGWWLFYPADTGEAFTADQPYPAQQEIIPPAGTERNVRKTTPDPLRTAAVNMPRVKTDVSLAFNKKRSVRMAGVMQSSSGEAQSPNTQPAALNPEPSLADAAAASGAFSVHDRPTLQRIVCNTRPEARLAVQASKSRVPPITSFPTGVPVEKTVRKWSVELVAGSDIFRLNRQPGYYGGIRINRHLDQSTLLSAGFNYSGNTLNEDYRLSDKPAQQTETDARLNHIAMIRMPLYFQRQLPGSKWALMAGLVPSYVIDASVYNVPNSYTGDPTQYRRFTIHDINRFNVLFGAGVKFSPFNRLAFELSGSYGFTGLVKDSYINQARVNDNFRNIQAGLVYRLR